MDCVADEWLMRFLASSWFVIFAAKVCLAEFCNAAGLNVNSITLVTTRDGGISLPATTDASATGSSKGGGSSNVGAIAGGIVGGIVAGFLLLLCESH